MPVELRRALISYQDYHTSCLSSCDGPSFRTRITTCCRSLLSQADTIGTDVTFNPEEQQIFDLLRTQAARTPDACACLCKIAVVLKENKTGVKEEWRNSVLKTHVAAYVERAAEVSAECRLNLQQETVLLGLIEIERADHQLRNRRLHLQLLHSAQNPSARPAELCEYSCADGYAHSAAAHDMGAPYSEAIALPQTMASHGTLAMPGPTERLGKATFERLYKSVEKGGRLQQIGGAGGFRFLYKLLTASVDFDDVRPLAHVTVPGQDPAAANILDQRELASFLSGALTFSPEELSEEQVWSVLRVLERNPELCRQSDDLHQHPELYGMQQERAWIWSQFSQEVREGKEKARSSDGRVTLTPSALQSHAQAAAASESVDASVLNDMKQRQHGAACMEVQRELHVRLFRMELQNYSKAQQDAVQQLLLTRQELHIVGLKHALHDTSLSEQARPATPVAIVYQDDHMLRSPA